MSMMRIAATTGWLDSPFPLKPCGGVHNTFGHFRRWAQCRREGVPYTPLQVWRMSIIEATYEPMNIMHAFGAPPRLNRRGLPYDRSDLKRHSAHGQRSP